MTTKDVTIQLKLDVKGLSETPSTLEQIKNPKRAGRPATGVKRSVFSTSLSGATGITKSMLTEKAFELFFEQQGDFYEELLEKQRLK